MATNAKEASDILSEALLQLDNVLSGICVHASVYPSFKIQELKKSNWFNEYFGTGIKIITTAIHMYM